MLLLFSFFFHSQRVGQRQALVATVTIACLQRSRASVLASHEDETLQNDRGFVRVSGLAGPAPAALAGGPKALAQLGDRERLQVRRRLALRSLLTGRRVDDRGRKRAWDERDDPVRVMLVRA